MCMDVIFCKQLMLDSNIQNLVFYDDLDDYDD